MTESRRGPDASVEHGVAATWQPVARCALCSLAANRGYLCDAHGRTLAIGTVTPEQIDATAREPVAALIDPWGDAHGVEAPCAVGRDARGVSILHASVSKHHATIDRRGERWWIVDAGSKNGTFVDGARVTEAALLDGARVQFGEVPFYFVGRALPGRPRAPGPGRTAPTRRDLLIFSARLALPAGARAELAQRVEGGVLRVGDAMVELGKLEFRLLQVLTEARQIAVDPEHAYRSWQDLATQLEFRSHDADSENVRELVRRVRRKLGQAGVASLVESRHGVGYRLAADMIEG